MVGSAEITGTLKNAAPARSEQFNTDRVDPALAQDLAKSKVTFSGEPAPGYLAAILGWLASLLFFGLIWFLAAGGRMGGPGRMLAVGKSKARVYAENDVSVRFKDVTGVDEAKAELEEVVDFLKARLLMGVSARMRPRAYYWSVRRVPAKRCWHAPWRVRQALRSSPSRVRNSLKCLSVSVRHACVTCSNRPAAKPRQLFSSMS